MKGNKDGQALLDLGWAVLVFLLAVIVLALAISGCSHSNMVIKNYAGAQKATAPGRCKKVPVGVTTTALPDATVGAYYSVQLSASGGCPPYHWRLSSGTLPDGLTLSDAGLISGTPTGAGLYVFCAGDKKLGIRVKLAKETVREDDWYRGKAFVLRRRKRSC